jgi:hypothetical protein
MWFCPHSDLRVDCYVNADFAGSFSVTNKQDPVCAKSRTGPTAVSMRQQYSGWLIG